MKHYFLSGRLSFRELLRGWLHSSGWPSRAAMLLVMTCATGVQAAGTTPSPARPDPPSPPNTSGNRIEVTGNSVSGVRCANGGAVSVNSVNVEGASLKGRTVIVQGKNQVSGKDIDCSDQPGGARQAPAQINSITIR